MQERVIILKRKTIIFLTMVLTVIFSAITSSLIVNADELDGYTKVDWSWNRDMETTDAICFEPAKVNNFIEEMAQEVEEQKD